MAEGKGYVFGRCGTAIVDDKPWWDPCPRRGNVPTRNVFVELDDATGDFAWQDESGIHLARRMCEACADEHGIQVTGSRRLSWD
nr:hypothetical protein [Candidatus Sigynarchaeum springense]